MRPKPASSLGAGVFGASLPGMAVLNTFPFLAGALIDDRKMTAAAAGALLSLELLASAVALLTCCYVGKKDLLDRLDGALFLILWAAYMVYLFIHL